MEKKTIALIGECMVELQRNAEGFSYKFGGDTLNTAIYLARLLPAEHFKINYVTGLGTDLLSAEMRSNWEAEGITTDWVQEVDGKLPGMYLIETDSKGERSFQYWRNDSAARYWLQGQRIHEISNQLETASWIYLSGISIAILSEDDQQQLFNLLQRCRQRGATIIFDNNYRPRLWKSTEQARVTYAQMLSLTDIALLTLDDEVALHGNADADTVITRAQQLGAREIVIKRGEASCIVELEGKRTELAPGPVSHVIDTTAAGDSFAAAYLAARMAGCPPEAAIAAGHRLAGKVIQYKGAIIPRSAVQPVNALPRQPILSSAHRS